MKTTATLLLSTALALAGCGSAKPIMLADGTQGQALRCNGTLSDWTVCLQKAGELCGARGYDTIDRRSEVTWDTTTRVMVVRCR